MTTAQKPTVGRIVHYQQVCAYEVGPDTDVDNLPALPLITKAAIIVGLKEVDGVTWPVLRILCDYKSEDFTVDCSPGGYERDGVREAAEPTMGCWNWPPRA